MSNMFEEIPKVEFTVIENDVVVYRDAIIFDNMTELRNTSQAERQAMFLERYNNWKAFIASTPEETETPEEN